MSEALPACIADFDGCITCGDHAVDLRVVSVDDELGLALCADDAGSSAEVDVVSLRLGMLRAVPPSDLFEANVRELEGGNPLQQIAGRILTGEAYAARFGF